jgi:hypothetical protein
MKLPEWDEQYKTWDKFKAFHIGITRTGLVQTYPNWSWQNWSGGLNFIMFDTGELIYRPTNVRPDCRGLSEQLNVGIYRTIDRDCPRLYLPDGKLIPKSWLNYRGSQLIIVDHDSGQVFPAEGYTPNETVVNAPARFAEDKSNRLYWPGPGKPAINLRPGCTITVKKPYATVLAAEEQEHIDTILTTARAAMALTEHPMSKLKYQWQTHYQGNGVPANVLLGVKQWTDLDDNQLYDLFHGGVDRIREEHTHLTIEGGK